MNNKKLPIYAAKTLSFKAVDMDSGSRTVKGYLSAFNVIDSDNDIILPGAFKKSILENGPLSASNRKIAFLRNHEWEDVIGKMLEMEEDAHGLLFTAQLGRSSKGEDAMLDYQDGIIREHSIGFNYVPDKIKFIETQEGGYFTISEVKLWEGSAVLFGANQFTPVLHVAKGIDTTEARTAALSKLAAETEAITKALRNGKGTDDRLQELEMRIKVNAQKYEALATDRPQGKAPVPVVEPQTDPQISAAQKFFIQLLTNNHV